MTLHPTGIWGLDLVLGGGIQGIARAENQESAILLLRGPPGAGKTVLGAHLASALAQGLSCDVAYACVELLPVELQAQLKGFHSNSPLLPVVTRLDDPARYPAGHKIFAAGLDLEPDREISSLGDALQGLLDLVEQSQGQARVLVIDCLSDGYHLGSTVPRSVVDSLCKFAAERGFFLILLEESTDSRPTSWSFAVDVVIELSRGQRASAGGGHVDERQITIQKNRFGPCEIGPHTLVLDTQGARIWPNPAAFAAIDLQLPYWPLFDESQPAWPFQNLPAFWPRFRRSITAVYGPDAGAVLSAVLALGLRDARGNGVEGVDLVVDLSGQTVDHPDNVYGRFSRHVVAGHPFMMAGELLFETLIRAKVTLARGSLRRLLIGDCRALRSYRDQGGIRQALGFLATHMKKNNIPTIFFETASQEHEMAVVNTGMTLPWSWYRDLPTIVDFANVVIDVGTKGTQAIDTSTGHKVSWTPEKPTS